MNAYLYLNTKTEVKALYAPTTIEHENHDMYAPIYDPILYQSYFFWFLFT